MRLSTGQPVKQFWLFGNNFFFFFFFFNLGAGGERSIKNNQAKIQFEPKIRTPNQDLKIIGQKPDTEQVQRPAGGSQ